MSLAKEAGEQRIRRMRASIERKLARGITPSEGLAGAYNRAVELPQFSVEGLSEEYKRGMRKKLWLRASGDESITKTVGKLEPHSRFTLVPHDKFVGGKFVPPDQRRSVLVFGLGQLATQSVPSGDVIARQSNAETYGKGIGKKLYKGALKRLEKDSPGSNILSYRRSEYSRGLWDSLSRKAGKRSGVTVAPISHGALEHMPESARPTAAVTGLQASWIGRGTR